MYKHSFCIWVAIFLVLSIDFMPGVEGLALTFSPSASDVISAVNSLRASHGLPAYAVNSILMGTAQAQADYMASIGTFSHTGPGGSSVTQRLLAAGYPLAGDLSLGGFRSENVVMGSGMTPAEAVASWTTDSLHLNTMLSPDLQEIGAGVAEKDGTFYYVIDCARPTSGGVLQAYTPGAEAALSGGEGDIVVPVAMSTPDKNGDIYHEVKPGQSLWQIAIAYGVKINDILQLNSLGPTPVLQPGDKLLIKRLGTATPQPPTATATVDVGTWTPFPTIEVWTATPTETPTPLPVAPASSLGGAGGAIGAIVVVALAAAGLVAWVGRTRQV